MGMLAQMTWPQWMLAVLMIGICCFLMLVVLLQRGRGGGLTGAFGGSGGSSAFGAKTGDVFTWITVVVAGIFVVLAVLTNFAMDETERPRQVTTTPSAPSPATPSPVDGPAADSLPGAGDSQIVIPIGGGVPPGEPQLGEADTDDSALTGEGAEEPLGP